MRTESHQSRQKVDAHGVELADTDDPQTELQQIGQEVEAYFAEMGNLGSLIDQMVEQVNKVTQTLCKFIPDDVSDDSNDNVPAEGQYKPEERCTRGFLDNNNVNNKVMDTLGMLRDVREM